MYIQKPFNICKFNFSSRFLSKINQEMVLIHRNSISDQNNQNLAKIAKIPTCAGFLWFSEVQKTAYVCTFLPF